MFDTLTLLYQVTGLTTQSHVELIDNSTLTDKHSINAEARCYSMLDWLKFNQKKTVLQQL